MIGQSPNNLDQIIEINKGSNDGIRVGMPVVNPAGADRQGHRAHQRPGAGDADHRHELRRAGQDRSAPSRCPRRRRRPPRAPASAAPPGTGTRRNRVDDRQSTTSTVPPTTTTLPDPQRETGQMVGRGVDEPPRVNLVDDSPPFGTRRSVTPCSRPAASAAWRPADLPIGSRVERRARLAVGGLDPRGRPVGRSGQPRVRAGDPLHHGDRFARERRLMESPRPTD